MANLTLYHGNIYNCVDKLGSAYIAMYLCDTNLGNVVCMVPLYDDDHISSTFSVSGLNKVIYPEMALETSKNDIISVLRIKGKAVVVDYSTYLNISEIILNKLLNKTSQTYTKLSHQRFSNINHKNYILTEDYYKYLTWFDYKSKLQFQKNLNSQPGIAQYGVYWAEIGRNIGSELEKLRPVLIWKKMVSRTNPNDSSYIVIPLTSKQSSSKYTVNHRININGTNSWAKVNDMRRISVKRIVKPFLDSHGNPVFIDAINVSKIKNIIYNYFIK